MPKFVDIETPYSGKNEKEIRRNLLYARACMRDSLMRGEIPFASHLLYTQPGILDDDVLEEREKGIMAGKELIESLPNIVTVIYLDLGISNGMRDGIDLANERKRVVEYRSLGTGWEERELKIARKHSHAALWGLEDIIIDARGEERSPKSL
ncbi:hypothetical protein HYT58_01135 [Candidatus Woesearchaeota archaeon]|nr:hypothetical protein [Candidatus Woesearchaeota archaeon]